MTKTFLVVAVLAAGLGLAACGQGGGDSGAAQKTAGKIEHAAGSITGDDHLKREGKKDEVVGGVKDAVHDVKGSLHDATH